MLWNSVYEYWLGKHRDGRPPSRADIDPFFEIPDLLPNLYLIDVEQDRFRFRLVGSEITRRAGRETTGRTIDRDLLGEESLTAWLAVLRKVAHEQCPVLYGFSRRPSAPYDAAGIILPLVDQQGRIAMLMGAIFFDQAEIHRSAVPGRIHVLEFPSRTAELMFDGDVRETPAPPPCPGDAGAAPEPDERAREAPDRPKLEMSSALFDRDGRLLEWNAGFAAEFEIAQHLIAGGVPFRDILQCAYESALGPTAPAIDAGEATRDLGQRVAQRMLSFGRPASFDYQRLDGRWIHVHEQLTPSGGLSRVAYDVTAEYHGQSAAHRAQAAAPTPIEVPIWFRRHADQRLTFAPASDALRRLLDLPPEFGAVDPLALYSLVQETPEERERGTALFEQSLRNQAPFSSDFRVRSPNGQMKHLRATFAPLPEEDGGILWNGLVRDVTNERRAEAELDLLRAAVVHSSDGIMICETSPDEHGSGGLILYVNRAFEQLTGYAAEALVGRTTEDFRPRYQTSDLRDRLRAALRTGDSRGFEFELAKAGDSSLWVEGRIATLETDPNGAFRWALVVRDIAERRRIHAELMDAKNRAEAANRSKSQFLANMSHEFRTPLNAIIGFSEIIKDRLLGPDATARYREYAGDINSSGKHLLEIINDVLEMSKIEAEKLELHETEIDFAEIVEAVLKFVVQQAKDNGVTITPEIGEELPRLRADSLRLKQILLNLISNAVKFCERGGKVSISAALCADGAFEIKVGDTGIGMTEAEIEIALQPFRQVGNELSRKYGGTGLGLPLADALVALHGGRLQLASTPGVGTTATVRLPAGRVIPAAPARVAQARSC